MDVVTAWRNLKQILIDYRICDDVSVGNGGSFADELYCGMQMLNPRNIGIDQSGQLPVHLRRNSQQVAEEVHVGVDGNFCEILCGEVGVASRFGCELVRAV